MKVLGVTLLFVLSTISLAAEKPKAPRKAPRKPASSEVRKTVCGKFIVEKDAQGYVSNYFINDGTDGNFNANHALMVDDSNTTEGSVAAIRSLQNSILSLMVSGKKYCVAGKVSRTEDPSEPAYVTEWDSVQAKR